MKRSLSSISNETTPLKRSASADMDNNEDPHINPALVHRQNREMTVQMRLYRRKAVELRRELESVKRRANENERAVSLIQRSWEQINVAANTILNPSYGSISDSEAEQGSDNLLQQYLDYMNSPFLTADPTNQLQLQLTDEGEVDEWATEEQLYEPTKDLLEILESQTVSNEVKEDDEPDSSDYLVFLGELEDNLDSRITVTSDVLMKAMKKLLEVPSMVSNGTTGSNTSGDGDEGCSAKASVTDASTGSTASPLLDSVAEAVVLQAERSHCKDRIISMSTELVKMAAKLRDSEQQKAKLTRVVEKKNMLLADQLLKQQQTQTASSAVALNGIASDGGGDGAATSSALVTRLEKQLEESEAVAASIRTAHQQYVMERHATQPNTYSASNDQVSRLKREIDMLKNSHKERLYSLVAETSKERTRAAQYQTALSYVECAQKKLVDETVLATEKLKLQLQEEIKTLKGEIVVLKTENLSIITLKEKVASLTELEASTRLEYQRWRDKYGMIGNVAAVESKQTAVPDREDDDSDVVMSIDSPVESATDTGCTTADWQARVTAAEKVANECKAQLEDNIEEIEALAGECDKWKGLLSTALNRDEPASNSFNSSARRELEEIIKLRSEVVTAKSNFEECQTKFEASAGLRHMQDNCISQYKITEKSMLDEVNGLTTLMADIQSQHAAKNKEFDTLVSELSASKKDLEALELKHEDMSKLLGDSSSSLQLERKKRMDMEFTVDRLQTEVKKKDDIIANQLGASGASSSSAMRGEDNGASAYGGGAGMEDNEMLEDLLGVLRCPVCEDEFVNAILCRCCHLFCKGCVDKNFANRDRKCPVCKEKFGADDIKTVYFPQKRKIR